MAERRTKQGIVNMTSKGRNYYRLRKTVGYEVIDGKKRQIQKSFTGRNKSEAQAKYELWLAAQNHHESDESFASLADYFNDFVLKNDKKYAEGTIILYRGAYQRYVRPMKELMLTPISSVDIKTLQSAILSLDSDKISVKKNVTKWMRAFYKWASASGYCDDIASALATPSNRREAESDVAVWDDHSVQILLDFMQEEHHRLRFLVIFALNTGLRVAEILALTYDDLDNGYVTVNKQLQRGQILPPKSQDSYRSVPLNSTVQQELKLYRDEQQKEMRRCGYSTNLVFPTKAGHTMTYSVLRRSLERTYNRILNMLGENRAEEFTPHPIHAFRSTFATNLARNGVRLEVARKLLGHSSIEVTAKYYTSISDKDKEEAVEKLK